MKNVINKVAVVCTILCVVLFGVQFAYNNIITPALVAGNNNKIQEKVMEAQVQAENDIEEEIVEAETVEEDLVVENEEPQVTYVGMNFAEGDDYGIITIGNDCEIQVPVVCGTTAESIKNAVAVHPYSTETHKFVYGHNNKAIFGKLKNTATVGTTVTISNIDGTVENYVVREAHWVSEEEYNSQEYRNDIVLHDESALVIVTCCHIESGRGRWIVWCDLSTVEE